MRRERLLLAAAAALLLILVPCTYPPEPAEEAACIPPPKTSSSAVRWYDSGTLIFVPAGEFPMGSPGGIDNPEHRILLDDFWIHKTEVTNSMYATCVAAGGCSIPGPDPKLPDFRDPELKDNPVVGVTWAQADTYCKWIQGRLPTEAEWEKAARGTDGRPFPWGSEEPDCDRINFQQCVKQLTHVLEYPDGVSPYGGLDFSGNAFEWAADWYSPDYYPVSPPQNPPGPATGNVRLVRGGSFESTTSEVLASTRFSEDPLAVRADLGFRCVLLEPQSYSAPCQIPAHAGQPYTPREAPGRKPAGCEPPPLNVEINPFCQQKSAWTNITPNGAKIEWPAGTDCHAEGDVYACTGPRNSSFEIKACSSCVPPIPTPPLPEPASCPPGYALDPTGCVCRFVPSAEGYCTTCPSAFSLLYVPAQQCCELQPSGAVAAPACDPGYVQHGCTCVPRLPPMVKEVGHCETYNVPLWPCGSVEKVQPETPSECPEGGCEQPTCPVGVKCQ